MYYVEQFLGMVRKLFHVNYITSDSIEREKQQNTYLYFVDFLEECYGMCIHVYMLFIIFIVEGITMNTAFQKV